VVTRYADTSALARAYLPDGKGHGQLQQELLGAPGTRLLSQLTALELEPRAATAWHLSGAAACRGRSRDLVVVTRDDRQAAAARAEGLAVDDGAEIRRS